MRLTRVLFVFTAAAPLALSGGSVATAQLVDYDGGPVGSNAPSFNWEGFEFTLNSQPTQDQATAAHRVVEQSDGSIDIFLEESFQGDDNDNLPSRRKVTYKTNLPDADGKPVRNQVDFQYGEDLSEATPSFSFAQPFYRTSDGNPPSTAVAPLSGSAEGNENADGDPAPVFTGISGRAANFSGSGGFDQNTFIDNHDLGDVASFSMLTQPDGQLDADIEVASMMKGLDFDLTPNGEVSPFQFNELLLQAGSFQSDSSFQGQFGDTGQKFSFLSASSTVVPLPGSAWAGLSLLGVLGGGAAVRRWKAARAAA